MKNYFKGMRTIFLVTTLLELLLFSYSLWIDKFSMRCLMLTIVFATLTTISHMFYKSEKNMRK